MMSGKKGGRDLQTKVDRFGRVLIPKTLRAHLDLTPGTILLVDIAQGDLRMRASRTEPVIVQEGGVLVHCGTAEGDLVEAIRELRQTRLERLSSPRSRLA